MNEEELSFSFVNLFLFHRQSPDLRLRATMVFHLVGESARQGRREDVEEAHGVHDVQREPRVFRSEYTVGENGLRGEERWENLVDRHLPRLHRHDVAITDRRRCYALTAMSDRVTRSDTSVSQNANLPLFRAKIYLTDASFVSRKPAFLPILSPLFPSSSNRVTVAETRHD